MDGLPQEIFVRLADRYGDDEQMWLHAVQRVEDACNDGEACVGRYQLVERLSVTKQYTVTPAPPELTDVPPIKPEGPF